MSLLIVDDEEIEYSLLVALSITLTEILFVEVEWLILNAVLDKLSPINQGSFGTFQNPPLQYGAELKPEPGDIIHYQNAYWEVDNTNSTQLTTGKDPDYPYYDSNGNNPLNPGLENFGWSVEVLCECHYVPSDRLNIILSRKNFRNWPRPLKNSPMNKKQLSKNKMK